MSDGIEHSIIVPMSNELKESIKSEAARRQTTMAELIRAQMHFCLPHNIESSISVIADDLMPEDGDEENE
jgi:hypothetical protein